MQITVQVKPNSKKESVEQLAEGSYLVRVHAPPIDGKANKRVIELLAKHLHYPKSAFELTAGKKSKKKLLSIRNNVINLLLISTLIASKKV